MKRIAMSPSRFLAAVGLLGLATPLPADIPSWRNDGNGLYPGATPALEWEDRDLWTTALPDRGNASPIIVGERLFLTAEPTRLLCLDRKSGKILWERSNAYEEVLEMPAEVKAALTEAKENAEANKEAIDGHKRDLYRLKRQARRDRDNRELRRQIRELEEKIDTLGSPSMPLPADYKVPPTHNTNGYASYTPVSDGTHVFAAFGTGVVAAYDLAGGLQWATRLDNPDHNWGGASSPVLADGALVVRFSDWVGLDPATGKERWRVPTEITFNCPAVFEVEGRAYLYTARGQLIRAKDGKLLPSQDFTQDDKPWAFFNTPSVVNGRVYTVHGNEGGTGVAHAFAIPATTAELEKSGLQELWKQEVDKNRYYSSPLVHEGIVYIISREYVLQALNAKNGQPLYEQRLRGLTGTAYPSLTLAGHAIFVGAEDGRAVFFKPGRTYEELARLKANPFRATPLFDGKVTYLRTEDALRAIGAE